MPHLVPGAVVGLIATATFTCLVALLVGTAVALTATGASILGRRKRNRGPPDRYEPEWPSPRDADADDDEESDDEDEEEEGDDDDDDDDAAAALTAMAAAAAAPTALSTRSSTTTPSSAPPNSTRRRRTGR